jgi:hypothetical protein
VAEAELAFVPQEPQDTKKEHRGKELWL